MSIILFLSSFKNFSFNRNFIFRWSFSLFTKYKSFYHRNTCFSIEIRPQIRWNIKWKNVPFFKFDEIICWRNFLLGDGVGLQYRTFSTGMLNWRLTAMSPCHLSTVLSTQYFYLLYAFNKQCTLNEFVVYIICYFVEVSYVVW